MKQILYLLLILFISNHNLLKGQSLSPKWESCYGGSNTDNATGITYSNGYYYIVSNTNSNDGDVTNGHNAEEIWFLTVDSLGNLITEKTFGGSKADGGFVNIKKLNDTVFYIVGVTNSEDGDVSYNPWPGLSLNYWILQIKVTGEIVWEKVLGGSRLDVVRDMEVTTDGGIIALGLSNSEDGDISNHFGSDDLWLIKLSSQGVKQWDMNLGGIGFEEGASIKQTIDGGYIVAGSTDGSAGGNYDTACNYHGIEGESGGWADTWVIKFDSLRDIEWQQCYGGKYNDDSDNIIEVDDGYVVVGVTMSNDGDVSGFHGAPGNQEYGTDIWVFKIDKLGILIWQKCLGGLYYEFARNIFPTSDGGYMIIGATQSDNGDVEGFNGLEPGFGDDVWFAKIDSLGNLQWQYCYGDVGKEELYRGVVQKSDFNYVLTLGTNSDDWQCNINTAYPDVRIAQLYDSTLVGTNNNIALNKQYSIVASPNPAKDKITFTYNLPESTNQYHELYIFNSKGVVVDKVILDSYLGRVILDINSLEAGLYFYSVTLGNINKNGKFIVAK